MPIPDFETLMLPVLQQFERGARNVAECMPTIKAMFRVTDEEANQLIPSGRMTLLENRTHWARTYLSKAGLLQSPRRNLHIITDDGRRLLASSPEKIGIEQLENFSAFVEWRSGAGQSVGTSPSQAVAEKGDSRTPEEIIDAAYKIHNEALRDELLSLLQQVTPQRFERLILDLLAAMGYGGGDIANGFMTKAAGDGGIDGIVNEDALGLDAVYIQAKRYSPENKVSRPDIQRFVGSLTGEGANKGVFVTTSDFSREAHDYINRVQHRIVLINGRALAQHMIDYDVGVRGRSLYRLRSIDEDYFSA